MKDLDHHVYSVALCTGTEWMRAGIDWIIASFIPVHTVACFHVITLCWSAIAEDSNYVFLPLYPCAE